MYTVLYDMRWSVVLKSTTRLGVWVRGLTLTNFQVLPVNKGELTSHDLLSRGYTVVLYQNAKYDDGATQSFLASHASRSPRHRPRSSDQANQGLGSLRRRNPHLNSAANGIRPTIR
jgi:hypothetical protein